jgi:hypothetical protein
MLFRAFLTQLITVLLETPVRRSIRRKTFPSR